MKKVLIADDTKNIRLMLQKFFEIEGYHVTLSDNGSDTLAKLRKENFDLVMLDIKMPEMSGTEVLRQIRKAGIKTPVIVMTAYGTIKNAVETTNLGAVCYLQKPFTTDKMQKILTQLNDDNVLSAMDEQLSSIKFMIAGSQYQEALDKLKVLLKEYTLNPEIYHLLSISSYALENFEEARQYEALCKALQESV